MLLQQLKLIAATNRTFSGLYFSFPHDVELSLPNESPQCLTLEFSILSLVKTIPSITRRSKVNQETNGETGSFNLTGHSVGFEAVMYYLKRELFGPFSG